MLIELLKYLWQVFIGFPTALKLIWILNTSFVVLSFVFLMMIFTTRFKRERREKKSKKLEAIYRSLLLAYLHPQEDETVEHEFILAQFKPYMKNKFRRNILSEIILRLHRNMTGDIADDLEKLFIDLELTKDSYKKLYSSRWYLKIKGTRELTQLGIQEVAGELRKNANKSNRILRKESQHALVRLLKFEGLNFLDEHEYPLSEYQQLVLLETINTFESEKRPSLTRWLDSKNDTVVLFSIKLVRVLNDISAKPALTDLLKHRNAKVRSESVNVLSELRILDVLPTLIERYDFEDKLVQLSVLKAIGLMGNESDLGFLEKQLDHPDFDLNMQAIETLKLLNGEHLLMKKKELVSTLQSEMIAQVLSR